METENLLQEENAKFNLFSFKGRMERSRYFLISLGTQWGSGVLFIEPVHSHTHARTDV